MLRSRLWFILLFCLAGAARAETDRVDELARSVIQDPSFKVRLQSALVLAQLGDRRAVPSLIKALEDENESVRGVAATALGRLGDRRALDALKIKMRDPSAFVRNQAKRAYDHLLAEKEQQKSEGEPRFFLSVGYQPGKQNAKYAPWLRSELAGALEKLPAVTVLVGEGGEPAMAWLLQKRVRGYSVDGVIQRLQSTPSGGEEQIDCDVTLVVSSLPTQTIRTMSTEGASLRVVPSPEESERSKRECLRATIDSIRKDVEQFLKKEVEE